MKDQHPEWPERSPLKERKETKRLEEEDDDKGGVSERPYL